jgi:hypothetical protein
VVEDVFKDKDRNRTIISSENKVKALMAITGEKWNQNIKNDILELLPHNEISDDGDIL